MNQAPGILLTVVSFLGCIGPLIFIHELGHYFVGRLFGVKADAFSIGFGHELCGWTDKQGTRWKVGWMPLGGYVKFAGDMNPASVPSAEWLKMPAAERARTFQAKPLWQRFLIVLAGPATNFLFAIIVFACIFATYGEPRTPPVIAGIEQGSVAQASGFHVGDRIVAIDGRTIERFEDVVQIVSIRPGERLDFSLIRSGQPVDLMATPAADVQRDRFGNTTSLGRLGIAAGGGEMVRLRPDQVLGAAVHYTLDAVRMMVTTIGQVISGARSVKEMGGPLKIAQYSGEQAAQGWFDFIYFMTMISINLGFINLLPVPMLDGGHLFFYLIEAVRRRPIEARVQEWAFRSGLMLLLTLMLFVTFNDLASFGLWKRIAGLIG